jgi:DNA-binding MarR family transcriptional regulator
MVSRAVNSPDQACQSLKNLVSDTGYTDKAIRSRLQKMEEDGYIELVQSDADTRSKYAVPTPLFQAAVYLHAEQMRRIFAKDFLLIEKNDH